MGVKKTNIDMQIVKSQIIPSGEPKDQEQIEDPGNIKIDIKEPENEKAVLINGMISLISY